MIKQHLNVRVRRAGYYVHEWKNDYKVGLVSRIQDGSYCIIRMTTTGGILSIDQFVNPAKAIERFEEL